MSFKLAASLALLAISARLPVGLGLQQVSVDSCADLSSLADALEGDDVTATITNDLTCDVWTTVVVPSSRKLTVEAVKPSKRIKFINVRFEVEAREDSAEYDLVFTADTKWFTTIEADVFLGIQDVDGGVLNVQSGAGVLFEGYARCVGVSIASALICTTDNCVPSSGGWQDADHKDNGGCWYNEGRIRVEGDALFKRNDNSGGGENQPGGGGAVYNGASGTIAFANGIKAKSNDCNDDEGGLGGAIYNAGEIVVSGTASFSDNIGGYGGAIYNDEGATVYFDSDGSGSFFNNRHSPHNESGGHIFNKGSIEFGSYTKFLKGENVYTTGLMKFTGGALFRRVGNSAIRASGDFDFEDTLGNVVFKNNEAGYNDCKNLSYFVDGEHFCGP